MPIVLFVTLVTSEIYCDLKWSLCGVDKITPPFEIKRCNVLFSLHDLAKLYFSALFLLRPSLFVQVGYSLNLRICEYMMSGLTSFIFSDWALFLIPSSF